MKPIYTDTSTFGGVNNFRFWYQNQNDFSLKKMTGLVVLLIKSE